MQTQAVRVHSAGTDPALALDRTWSASHGLIPWLQQTVDLTGARVLEYGCGDGLVSRAFAAHAAFVDGIDIDADAVARGRAALARDGIDNVALEHHPVEQIIDALRDRAGEVDVVLLYAVVEHLSIDERLEVLDAARRVALPDGVVVVTEAPNRLASFDAHSIQLPYFSWLPNELARRYVDRSQRADMHELLRAARAAGPAAEDEFWVRFGTGVSFHEFELVFGDELARHVLAGGYDSVLWPTRPLHPGELELAADLRRQRPDLGPAWSRYWLDLVLSPTPVDAPPKLVAPWPFETGDSTEVAYTRWNSLAVGGPRSRIGVRPDRPTRRVVVGFLTAPGEATLTVACEGTAIAEVPTRTERDVARYVEVAWDDATERVDLSLSTHGQVVLVACEQ